MTTLPNPGNSKSLWKPAPWSSEIALIFVSIRARHCWRAMRFQLKALKRLTSSTISREQGAMNMHSPIFGGIRENFGLI
jgi:hypothetical protein